MCFDLYTAGNSITVGYPVKVTINLLLWTTDIVWNSYCVSNCTALEIIFFFFWLYIYQERIVRFSNARLCACTEKYKPNTLMMCDAVCGPVIINMLWHLFMSKCAVWRGRKCDRCGENRSDWTSAVSICHNALSEVNDSEAYGFHLSTLNSWFLQKASVKFKVPGVDDQARQHGHALYARACTQSCQKRKCLYI